MSKKLNAAQITKEMKRGYGSMNAAYNQLNTNEKIITAGIAVSIGLTVAKAVKLLRKKSEREHRSK
ncbi:MAG: hypothetical protein E7576_07140 [Ruminococcaceae bacterium]|nr:hypothetical protein [Oscillospiraceae bacterium]